MPYQFPPDVQQLVHDQLASGQYSSEDDVLRTALHSLIRDEEDLAAIQEAINEMGKGNERIPLDEAFATIRAKHSNPQSP